VILITLQETLTYVEESFEVMTVYGGGRTPTSKLGMTESMGGDFFQGGG